MDLKKDINLRNVNEIVVGKYHVYYLKGVISIPNLMFLVQKSSKENIPFSSSFI